MRNYMRRAPDRRTEKPGASAVEYCLLVALIVAVILVAVFALGSLIKTTFQSTCTTTNGASASADSCEPAPDAHRGFSRPAERDLPATPASAPRQ